MRDAQAVLDRKAAADAKRAAAEQAERQSRLDPIGELIASDAFKEVQKRTAELAPTVADMVNVHSHLSALASIMPRLAEAVPAKVETGEALAAPTP